MDEKECENCSIEGTKYDATWLLRSPRTIQGWLEKFALEANGWTLGENKRKNDNDFCFGIALQLSL